jgi:integrase/recombinase XerC
MLKERFIDYLRFEKRFSPNTILSYKNDLDQFTGYLQSQYNIPDLSLADHVMIRSWIVFLLENELSPRSVNRKLSSLKSFYHYCLRVGEVSVNPTLKVISPKISKHLPVFIEKEKLERLFSEIDFGTGFEAVRDRLLIMMLYATGMRRAEIIGIRTNDIDFTKSTLKVLGKRNKERIIPIGSYLCNQTDIYIKERDAIKDQLSGSLNLTRVDDQSMEIILNANWEPGKNNNDFLFVSSVGCKMDARQVYSIVHKYLSLISPQIKLSPHVLRHSFATHMLNEGADLNAIKEILGHTSLAATQVYTHTTIDKLKLIHKQAHPRA